MYNKTLFVGGGGAAVWGASAASHSGEHASTVTEHGPVVMHFVREAFVAFPGQGPTFWILNVLAIIVGINTIGYALLALWKMRPRRPQPIIDSKYADYTPYGEPAVAN